MSGVTGEGGAMDRTMVVASVLLVLTGGFLLVVGLQSRAWVTAGFWAVVVLGALASAVHFARRVRPGR